MAKSMWYHKHMKITVQEFADKFRSLLGDEALSLDDDYIINSLNWAFNSLPSVPKLYKAWQEHHSPRLNANGHYRWKLKTDFRNIIKFEYINFYTSTGGDPCPLCICYRDNAPFYAKNGLVELKVAGKPCEYTIEHEDDDTYIVLDRPSNVPIILDYIAYGRPKPVTSMEDTFECPGCIENLIFSAVRKLYYQYADDFNFAESIATYLDSKEIAEAIQELNQYNITTHSAILGEAAL